MNARAFGYTALVVANLLPLAGALFFGWQVREILLVYWAESAVIAVYNALRMLLCQVGELSRRLPLVAFFLVHFGVFMFVHGVFILVLTNDGAAVSSGLEFRIADNARPSMLLAVAAMAVSHGAGFVGWLASGARRSTDARTQMMAPYGRIVVMHVTILGGAFLVQLFGGSIGLLVALVVLKLALDLRGHQRQDAAATPAPEPPATIRG